MENAVGVTGFITLLVFLEFFGWKTTATAAVVGAVAIAVWRWLRARKRDVEDVIYYCNKEKMRRFQADSDRVREVQQRIADEDSRRQADEERETEIERQRELYEYRKLNNRLTDEERERDNRAAMKAVRERQQESLTLQSRRQTETAI